MEKLLMFAPYIGML